MLALKNPFAGMRWGNASVNAATSVPDRFIRTVTSVVPVFTTWISDCGLTSGKTNSEDDDAATAPSANVEKSPENQNPCRPAAALVAWTHPLVVAVGNNSLPSLASCPPAVIVCDVVRVVAPSSP